MLKGSVFLLWPLLLLLGACGLGGPLREDRAASGYNMETLPASRWKAEVRNPSGADSVFENPVSKSVLAVNSVCERYPAARLESLAKQLTSPLSEVQLLTQEKRLLDGRESLWTRVKAKLDGVPVESLLVVVRKDNCIFDFQIHARDTLPVEDEKDFSRFVNSFRYSQPGPKP